MISYMDSGAGWDSGWQRPANHPDPEEGSLDWLRRVAPMLNQQDSRRVPITPEVRRAIASAEETIRRLAQLVDSFKLEVVADDLHCLGAMYDAAGEAK